MNAVIFARVSRKDQDYQRQLQDLRAVATGMGSGDNPVKVVKEITEKISGATRNRERASVQELLTLASQGKVDKVLVQEVSRLGRSTVEVLQVVEELTELGVSIYVQNFGIETLKKGRSGKLQRNPVAQFLFTMLAEFARLERETLRERILSGMEEARRKGKKIGRPEGSHKEDQDYLKDYPSVIRNLKQGLSLRQTAKVCGVAVNTVRKVKSAMEP